MEMTGSPDLPQLQVVIGDITRQPDCDAIVNAANDRLMAGSGVCGAIFRAAGQAELASACRKLAPVGVSEAVITPGFQLPNAHIIHCVGPRYFFDPDPEALLEKSYLNIINLAEANGVASIAIPAISTGVYAFPVDAATRICVTTFKQALPRLMHLKLIRFVVVSEEIATRCRNEIKKAA